jgi:hypothetical protein
MGHANFAACRLAARISSCAMVFSGVLSIAAIFFSIGCTKEEAEPSPSVEGEPSLNAVAEAYVKLGLAVGNHDPDYVDAYLGPPEWREEVKRAKPSLSKIRSRAVQLMGALDGGLPSDADEMVHLRHRALRKQIESLATRVEMLEGRQLSFDEESRGLYDAVAPVKNDAQFQALLDELAHLLPGDESLFERYEAFRKQFEIPRDRLDAVFQTAIAECRVRTMRFISLPEEESFEMEYVTDKPWSAYNWYQGSYHSLIQINTSLPTYIGDAVDLACHEGYPGHHVENILRERDLLRGRDWIEFSLFPLFSPLGVISEGSAEYGISMAFPDEERVAFERERLFPLAGLDPDRAEEYHQVRILVRELDSASIEAARRYLDGEFNRQQTVDWLENFSLSSGPEAEKDVRFIEAYRSYVINYSLGKDLVQNYVETGAGSNAPIERRWQMFEQLLASTRIPSDLD